MGWYKVRADLNCLKYTSFVIAVLFLIIILCQHYHFQFIYDRLNNRFADYEEDQSYLFGESNKHHDRLLRFENKPYACKTQHTHRYHDGKAIWSEKE